MDGCANLRDRFPPARGFVSAGNLLKLPCNKVGHETHVRLLVKGDMGAKEIGRLIKILEAQKEVLEDE